MEQRKDAIALIEKGWKFPVTVDGAAGRIRMSNGEDNIEESIRIILGTRVGERVMEPEFGCRIWDHTLDSVEGSTLDVIKDEAEAALNRWEPRITETEVQVIHEKANPRKFLLQITYKLRFSGNSYHMEFPFCRNLGGQA